MKRRDFIGALGASAASFNGISMAFADDDDDKKRRGRRRRDREDDHDDDHSSDNSDSDGPATPSGNASGRIVVVGGGMGGASAAKFLRLWGGPNLHVTLVERNNSYVSNIMSNLVLNGSRTIGGLTYGYQDLVQNYGVERIVGEVGLIDPVAHTVSLLDGRNLPYDRLVMSPGIEMDGIAGLESIQDQAAFPHAWKAGAQTSALRDQVMDMPDGGVFVMTIPAAPYRCPPGPYERACVVADYLKRHKSNCKVIVLDANPSITAERETFTHAFEVTHRDLIEYVPNASLERIDPATRTAYTTMGPFSGNVVNPIPPQRAGAVLARNGLINVADRWAGVDVLSYEATAAAHVHILGDSAGTTQPKAGHIANTEAKVCADAIVRLLTGNQPDPSPVTNSACYSPITARTASWLTAVFGYDPVSRTMKVVPGASGEAPEANAENFDEMEKWFDQLMADTFA